MLFLKFQLFRFAGISLELNFESLHFSTQLQLIQTSTNIQNDGHKTNMNH